MTVNSRQAAWAEADRLFPTDYMKDDRASMGAGYDIYYSTSDSNQSWISDLGDRLELNICSKRGVESINIWIEEEPEIEVEDRWSSEDVRHLCIKHELYTEGDTRAYSKMLDMVDELTPTTANIYKVALDIAKHSKDQPPVETVMFILKREAVMTFYSLNM